MLSTIQDEIHNEFVFQEPCQKKVSSNANINQLIHNSAALRDYNQKLGMPIPEPGMGLNWQKKTNLACTTTDGDPNGTEYIYFRSKSNSGLIQSVIFQIINFFENLATKAFIVCCPSHKIDNNDKCTIEYFQNQNPYVQDGRNLLIFIFMIIGLVICLRYI